MEEGWDEGAVHEDVALLGQLGADGAGLGALVGPCPADALLDGQRTGRIEGLQKSESALQAETFCVKCQMGKRVGRKRLASHVSGVLEAGSRAIKVCKNVDPVLVSPTIMIGGSGHTGIVAESFSKRYSFSKKYIRTKLLMHSVSRLVLSLHTQPSPGLDISVGGKSLM